MPRVHLWARAHEGLKPHIPEVLARRSDALDLFKVPCHLAYPRNLQSLFFGEIGDSYDSCFLQNAAESLADNDGKAQCVFGVLVCLEHQVCGANLLCDVA